MGIGMFKFINTCFKNKLHEYETKYLKFIDTTFEFYLFNIFNEHLLKINNNSIKLDLMMEYIMKHKNNNNINNLNDFEFIKLNSFSNFQNKDYKLIFEQYFN